MDSTSCLMMSDSPRSLDELLERVPGLRKRRSLSAYDLRGMLDRQRRECTWCGLQVGKGRSKWCSDDCVTAFLHRCSPQHQVAAVLKRDQGICRLCGRNVVASKRRYAQLIKEVRQRMGVVGWGTMNYEPYRKECERLEKLMGYGRGCWWEVDHIVPVVEGGGLCGLENLRLLCGACHASETAALSKRRRKPRGKSSRKSRKS